MISALLASLLVATTDPCSAAEAPPLPEDAVTARAYQQVGDAHRAAKEWTLAAIAYREALRRAPDDASLKAALEAVCHPPQDPLVAGEARFEAGDFQGALPLLEAAREQTHDPSASLLAGIALFKLGRAQEAEVRLTEAGADPDVGPSARFFLGLIALERGEGGRAESLFDGASKDPALAGEAQTLRAVAATEGKLTLSAFLATHFDTNPTQLPTSAQTGGEADAGLTLTALALATPFGKEGPYARLSGTGTLQAQVTEYDLGSGTAAVGWRLGRGAAQASAEYAFTLTGLGGDLYLLAHTLRAQGQLAAGPWSFGASYGASARDFRTDAASPYSGWLQRVHAWVGHEAGPGRVFLGYRGVHDGVTTGDLSYLEHAPWAELLLPVGDRLRLTVAADVAFRGYDAADTVLGVTRQDQVLEGSVAAAYDLSPRVSLRLTGEGIHQSSNVDAYSYDALRVSLGLEVAAGFF